MLPLTDHLSTEPTLETSVSLGTTENSSMVSPAATNGLFLDSEFRYTLLSVGYGIILVLGFFANCYVLFVLHRLRGTKEMREIRIYMTNLTVGDLMFVCALPFWIGYYSRHGDWVYSDFLCRLTGSMFFINTYCSIMFLVAISVNRYWAITRPLDAASSDNWRRGVAITITIWVATLAMAIPFLLSPAVHIDERNVSRCFEGYHGESDWEKRAVAATHFAIIGMFFMVFILVVVCNLLTAQALLKKSPTQRHSSASSATKPRGVKRRALQMLCAVVGVFVVCFLPHHIIQGPWTLAVLEIAEGWGSTSWDLQTRQALNDAHQITLLLMGLNCILDPIVYCFATRKFRKFIVAHFKRIINRQSCSHTANTQISMSSKHQSEVRSNELRERET